MNTFWSRKADEELERQRRLAAETERMLTRGKVGDRIHGADGRVGTVMKVHGRGYDVQWDGFAGWLAFVYDADCGTGLAQTCWFE